jgi:peptidoglycan/xylan/chitin deacetylase (PgdA/CDA1 family)
MLKWKRLLSLGLFFSVLVNASTLFPLKSSGANLPDDKDVDIYRKNENEYMKIALTFDDGPHPRYTDEILEILDEYGIKATFFVIGINARYYPETLESVIAKGHEIGNHTYSHPHVSEINSESIRLEIESCEEMIHSLSDYRTKLFRPPEGMVDGDVKSVLKKLDYKVILWDIDTRDWAHTSPEDICENVVNKVNSGDIILMHDYIGYNSPTPAALRLFIPKLLEKGYRFVVVSELIGA